VSFFFSPSSKCLHRFSTSCFFALHSLHSRRMVIFFVVFACCVARAHTDGSDEAHSGEGGSCATALLINVAAVGARNQQKVWRHPSGLWRRPRLPPLLSYGCCVRLRCCPALAAAECALPYPSAHLLMEHGLRLATEAHLLRVVTPLPLRETRGLAGLVLGHLKEKRCAGVRSVSSEQWRHHRSGGTSGCPKTWLKTFDYHEPCAGCACRTFSTCRKSCAPWGCSPFLRLCWGGSTIKEGSGVGCQRRQHASNRARPRSFSSTRKARPLLALGTKAGRSQAPLLVLSPASPMGAPEVMNKSDAK